GRCAGARGGGAGGRAGWWAAPAGTTNGAAAVTGAGGRTSRGDPGGGWDTSGSVVGGPGGAGVASRTRNVGAGPTVSGVGVSFPCCIVMRSAYPAASVPAGAQRSTCTT